MISTKNISLLSAALGALLPGTLLLGTLLPGMLLLSGCAATRHPEPAATNTQARLTGHLPYNPLAWKPITTLLHQSAGTASTLYGNDAAVAYARSSADALYPAGSVLAMVTWQQRDDPHWYGARIPGTPQTVEFVSIGAQPVYTIYRGSPLTKVDMSADQTTERIDYITHQRAAVMP